MSYSAKNFRKQLARSGTFYTDVKLAELMKSELEKLQDVTEVYDPTCGRGNLLAVFSDEVKKFGQELNKDELNLAKQNLINFVGKEGDTLQEPQFINRKFKTIIANPPFSVKWQPQDNHNLFFGLPTLPPPNFADWAFIVHCFQLLEDGGTAAILCFPGALYRGNKEKQLRQWLIETRCIRKIISIERGHFEDTDISTSLMILQKTYDNDCILMVDNKNNIEKVVTLQEIANNDFTLSVSNYITIEKPKEIINPLQLEYDARKKTIKRLQKEIEFSRMVCMLENIPFIPFLQELETLIQNEKQKPQLSLQEFLMLKQ